MNPRLPLLALLVAAGQAGADEPEPEPESEPAPASIALVDMSGGATALADEAGGWERGPGVEGEDVLLFVPRVVLSVPRLALGLVYLPLRHGLRFMDRHAVLAYADEVLYWNDQETAGWRPSISYQSDFGLTYGATVFHDSLLGYDEELSFAARFGGRYQQGYELTFAGDRVKGSRLWLEGTARFEANPKQIFAGVGMPADEVGALGWYRQTRVLGLVRLGHTSGSVGGLVKTGGSAIFNYRTFGELSKDIAGKDSIGDVYDTDLLTGFDDGALTLELTGNVVVDYRRSQGLDTTGTYLELFGGGVPPLHDAAYAHWGVELATTIDAYRGTRLVRLRGFVEAVHGEEDGIPFTDLPRLGGPDRLRGYREDQFRDRTAALASVEYQYPIHANLAGHLFVDAGTVSPDLGSLVDDLDDWRLGYGGGLVYGGSRDVSFRFDIARGDGLRVFLSTDLAHAFLGRSRQL